MKATYKQIKTIIAGTPPHLKGGCNWAHIVNVVTDNDGRMFQVVTAFGEIQ